MKIKLINFFINCFSILFVLIQVSQGYSQMNMESVSDDWKQQTANFVIIGFTTDNPDDYVWDQKTNQMQGVHIYVNPSEIVPIFI